MVVESSKSEFLTKEQKALIFVEHIDKHLKQMYGYDTKAKVMCKICNKTINEIIREHLGNVGEET